ncbi:hypothetical protein R6U77_00930 [Lysinibacillus louembei]|uniref:Uncharacterized protein n=1 Tax=Lysinibacillus louembei TaxID=1470088 RepID=A0ABZ0RVK8_9BACI|nr:hypothetical protein [Lysinibacillus louembei]WPK12283.1 hypothetical protein R6U77_00930 [Lysinibacillus louembei]
MTECESTIVAINQVLEDTTLDNQTKLERVEAYVHVFISNQKLTLEDVL